MDKILRQIRIFLGSIVASLYQEFYSSENYQGHKLKVLAKILDLELYTELPKPAKIGDAGIDLKVREQVTIEPGNEVLVKTGICLYTGVPYIVGLLLPRSSFRKYKCNVTNSVGIIDSGYQGEIMLSVHNTSDSPVTFNRGDRICQMVYSSCYYPVVEHVEEFPESERGESGYGSTGVK